MAYPEPDPDFEKAVKVGAIIAVALIALGIAAGAYFLIVR
jgi:hypothetical protein